MAKKYDGSLKSLEDKSRKPHHHPNEHTYVPRECMTQELIDKGERFYQYTAIDEYTRIRYTWFTNEHSTYMSVNLLKD